MNYPIETDGLRIYLSQIERYAILDRESEYLLAVRYRDQKDEEAAKTLITSNLRFVIKVALGYRNYGVKLMDLIQEGNIGLMKAVERFDPDRGYRLISYAIWWIKAYIQNFIIKSWSLVKIGTTQAQRKLFYRVSDLPEARDMENHLENVAKLADKISVTQDEVIEMAARLKAHDLSLDDLIGDQSRDSFADTLKDERPDQEETLSDYEAQQDLRMWAVNALETLNPREKYIVEQRILAEDPVTLKELGKHFGITRERARQIERSALEKLRGNYLRSELAA
ncbi:RNA polymerase factor sigma-32 [Desulfomonile tiedjei]|uniref:RNA polymerase sigma factor n=1 Tax=Desulfomonile tiedjei (strain ATCC 49306 / DSM 6799 / DCB-1) TaxID=706587 RepID=I4C437_DESTA|nr:RNA polymerase factor sigma-32 [Desulfomonile tiedjei]AFM24328.1 RNA polymerase, sigma 32 subunit, RpoH [Desulfomonile tiedjei DSM 6799]